MWLVNLARRPIHCTTFCLENKYRFFPTGRRTMKVSKRMLKAKKRLRRLLSWWWTKNAAIFYKFFWMWNTRTSIPHGQHPVNKMWTTQLQPDQRQDLWAEAELSGISLSISVIYHSISQVCGLVITWKLTVIRLVLVDLYFIHVHSSYFV